MFGGNNQQRPRTFDVEPMYYNPDKENPHHFNFRRVRHSREPKRSNMARLIIGAIILVAVIIYLQRMSKTHIQQNAPIEVQDVIVVD